VLHTASQQVAHYFVLAKQGFVPSNATFVKDSILYSRKLQASTHIPHYSVPTKQGFVLSKAQLAKKQHPNYPHIKLLMYIVIAYMKFSEAINSYFHFTKNERRAVVTALVLIVLISFVPFLYDQVRPLQVKQDTAFFRELAALQMAKDSLTKDDAPNNGNGRPANQYASHNYAPKGRLFPFDPNSIDEAGWQELGLRAKTIQTILHYRSKGGRFRKPEDLAKIWGLFQNEYERLRPYIQIAAANTTVAYPKNEFAANVPGNFSTPTTKTATIVEINAADTTALIALPFIGSKLAARILNYRDKLGGFVSVDQVGETWGLPDSTFQKIKNRLRCDVGQIKKIDLNTADANALRHPLIRWNIAKVLIEYRNQHGPYASLNDLLLTGVVDETLLAKIRPYLTVGAPTK
jgi:competence protein ComEA